MGIHPGDLSVRRPRTGLSSESSQRGCQSSLQHSPPANAWCVVICKFPSVSQDYGVCLGASRELERGLE